MKIEGIQALSTSSGPFCPPPLPPSFRVNPQSILWLYMYTRDRNFCPGSKQAGSQGNHKNWVLFMEPHRYLTDLNADADESKNNLNFEFFNLGFGAIKKNKIFIFIQISQIFMGYHQWDSIVMLILVSNPFWPRALISVPSVIHVWKYLLNSRIHMRLQKGFDPTVCGLESSLRLLP